MAAIMGQIITLFAFVAQAQKYSLGTAQHSQNPASRFPHGFRRPQHLRNPVSKQQVFYGYNSWRTLPISEAVRSLASFDGREVGRKCSAEDLQRASTDLSEITPGVVAAVQRSDKKWRYGRLMERSSSLLKFEVGIDQTKEYPKDQWDQVKALRIGETLKAPKSLQALPSAAAKATKKLPGGVTTHVVSDGSTVYEFPAALSAIEGQAPSGFISILAAALFGLFAGSAIIFAVIALSHGIPTAGQDTVVIKDV